MKSYTQSRKIISILMTFILMIEITGCYNSRIMNTGEIKPSDKYIVHGAKSKYHVYGVTVADNILWGKIDSTKAKGDRKIVNHIYLSTGSVININNDTLSIPVENITKIVRDTYDPVKTRNLTIIAAVVGVGCAVISIVLIVNAYQDADEVIEGSASALEYCFSN